MVRKRRKNIDCSEALIQKGQYCNFLNVGALSRVSFNFQNSQISRFVRRKIRF